MTRSTGPATVRVLAVADSDSYVKWSAATLQKWPSSWSKAQVVIDNPIRPSTAQIEAAGAGSSDAPMEVVSRGALLARIRREEPDVLLLACTGPVVAALTTSRSLRSQGRPVMVTGLPGISVPASRRALEQRRDADLLLLHSHREISAYARLRAELDSEIELGLATLPFLTEATADAAARVRCDSDGPVIFAAQAHVPPAREQRKQILQALAAHSRAVVKVRGRGGEEQTHRERWPYAELAADLVAAGRLPAEAISVDAGSMARALRGARGLVTVSSTAALEAVAADVPILILSDFGVSARLINVAFDGSGCLGSLDDLRHGHFTRPSPEWLRANYFHPAADNDAEARVSGLVNHRRAGQLPIRAGIRLSGWPALRARIRGRLRLLLPGPGRTAARLRLRLQSRCEDRQARQAAGAGRDRTTLAPPRGHPPG
jgi:CheY-like chemotaxis protein